MSTKLSTSTSSPSLSLASLSLSSAPDPPSRSSPQVVRWQEPSPPPGAHPRPKSLAEPIPPLSMKRSRSLPTEKSLIQLNITRTPNFSPSIVGNKEIGEESEYVQHELVPGILAEVLGTAILVFLGAGSILSNGGNLMPIALTFCFAVFALVIVFGSVSGAHFNPAVTLAFFLLNIHGPGWRGELIRLVCYTLSQMIGATLGSVVVHHCFPDGKEIFFGTRLSGKTSIGNGFLIETVVTFVLIFTVVTIHHNIKKIADKEAVASNDVITSPFAVAFVIGAGILIAGPYTGASINPARSFGPAIITGVWTHHWLYWVAPLTGSVLAVILYKAMHKTKGHPFLHRLYKYLTKGKEEGKDSFPVIISKQ